MSYVEDLVTAYARTVSLKWHSNTPRPERVWMVIYPPEQERRVRLHIRDFATATESAGHQWQVVDITSSFETWMSQNEYRDSYFEDPELLDPALLDFFDELVRSVHEQLERADDRTVVALLGAGSLYGLGDQLKVSALLDAVNDSISGRLLVFFPGQHEGNNYRLLGARDGWNYLAVPISADGGVS